MSEIKYGTLTLELDPADARVTRTDADATYRAGMRLAAGEHGVRVTRDDYQQVSRVVTVSGDTRVRIVLEPVEERTDDAAPPPEVEAALEPSGETEASTPVALESSLALDREERRRIQRSLTSLGLYAGAIDGLFGKNTRNALKTWQSSQKMAATGYLDADSAKALLAVQPETHVTVRTVPPNAKVRVFTPSGATYHDAMNVQPGRYEIAVDAPRSRAISPAAGCRGADYLQDLVVQAGKEDKQRICEDKPVERI